MNGISDRLWQGQQPARRRNPALAIVLLLLAVLVIVGGSGLTFLLVYLHQRSVAAQTVSAALSEQSAQMLYEHVIATKPAFNDPLTHGDMLLLAGDSCTAYTIRGLSISAHSENGGLSMCWSLPTNLNNFAFQVKMTIVRGDEGGLLFRIDKEKLNMCVFTINTEGAFNVAIFGNPLITLLHRPGAAIKVGLGQANVLTVISQGETALFYANDHYLGQVTNAAIPMGGGIGLAAYDLLDPTTVVFNNLRVWKL
jgi:hypothetical protein